MEKSRIFENQSFHMEPYMPDTHSLTQEEIEAELDRNTAEAIEGIEAYRRMVLSGGREHDVFNEEEADEEKSPSILGAIIGDISGSRFEFLSTKSKHFAFLSRGEGCRPTDDTIMTLAVAEALLNCNGDYSDLGRRVVEQMQRFGRAYPDAGYGGRFSRWLLMDDPKPYHSFGNGSAMRVSPCAYAARSLSEAIQLAQATAEVTHDHPEGIRGAVAVTIAIYKALHGSTIDEIEGNIGRNYYSMDFTLDSIRGSYTFDETCQGSVPQAMKAFFESTSFADAIRNAISLGGDADTQAAIAGSIAGAYYGVPDRIRTEAMTYLDETLVDVVRRFEERFLK